MRKSSLLTVSDHFPIDEVPKGFLRSLSRDWNVCFHYTKPCPVEQIYKGELHRSGIQMISPPQAEPSREAAVQALKEFLKTHLMDVVLLLGDGVSRLYLSHIRPFYPREAIVCFLPDLVGLQKNLEANHGDATQRFKKLREIEGVYRLADHILVDSRSALKTLVENFKALPPVTATDGKGPRSTISLSQTLRNLRKDFARIPAMRLKQTSLIFLADAPHSLVKRSLKYLKRNTPPTMERIFVGISEKGERGFPRTIMVPRREDFIFGVNQALKAARGEFIALVRSGSLSVPGWLERMLRCLRDPQVGAVGPCKKGDMGSPAKRGTQDVVERLNHSCWVLRRSALESAGLFDARFMWGNLAAWDYDLRLKQAGFNLTRVNDVIVPYAGKETHKTAEYDILVQKWCELGISILDELDAACEPGP